MPDSIKSCGELMTPPQQDHFAIGMRGDGLAAPVIFDAGGAAAGENDPRGQRAGHDREVGPRQGRPQIGVRGAAAVAVSHRHLPGAEAFLLGAVVVGGGL